MAAKPEPQQSFSLPLENASHAGATRPRQYTELFLISFAILFFELACIRWFASSVIFLTFFTNIVLLACFLGMSVGLLATARQTELIRTVVPLWAIAVILAMGILWTYNRFGLMIDVGGQRSPQQIYFGTEYRPADPSQFVIPIEVIAGLFFVLIGLMFVGLGQAMGRRFEAIPNRVAAYTTDISGSLAGIIVFAVASYFQTTPLLWFGVCLAVVFYLIRRPTLWQVLCALIGMCVITMSGYSTCNDASIRGCLSSALSVVTMGAYGTREGTGVFTFWSPYYRIRYDSEKGDINTNNIGHQQMVLVRRTGPAYLLPHQLNNAAGARQFEDVLIIGAGSGNDVSAALQSGARRVDAVEIDPVIQAIGGRDHPEKPYDDPRVTVHLDDGRSFVRRTDRKYDLVVYALVDSLVLHSGYSSLRLESFLFTEDAFEDVRRVLKPGGVFAMYNYYRQGWVVGRLDKMAEKVFGNKPIVISMPYQKQITSADSQRGHITFLLVGEKGAAVVEAIRGMLGGEVISGGGPWRKRGVGMADVQTAGIDRLPTDDWPFLYLRQAAVPALNVRGIVIIAILSAGLLLAFAPVRTFRLNGQMFFLGAGFMLLETKGVVHMALLFGSTWVVNSVVFAAILVMILFSNLFVLTCSLRRLWPFYALLTAALLVNALVPMSYFLSLPGAGKVLASCVVVFVPIFFGGVIFATAFRNSRQPDLDFGSNVAGVILGGVSEYVSLLLGFNHLLLIAVGFYLLSAMLRPGRNLSCAIA